MQSEHTWRGVQTCEHVPDDTTQAAAEIADASPSCSREKLIADVDASPSRPRSREKQMEIAPKKKRRRENGGAMELFLSRVDKSAFVRS
jgi:hypothetical protein